MQKYRISTNIGVDNKVVFELKQDYDLLEILSLKFTQSEVYSSMCADYGVVCGRVSVNNGFGVPNIRVSIFIPIQDEDVNDPVISALYPYTTVDDKNEEGYRYNLLPARRQHGGHAPTGTFPDQSDILTREEVLEVYEKYYKYTAKTNSAGDFMIWGVPVGSQTLHIEADLSDIGCFSLRPDDFIRQGMGVDRFKNSYEFNASNDLDSLPQIVSFNQTIEVYPFWGNEDLCEIGITRSDFDLSSRGVKIEPKAYLLGSVYSDQGKISVNKNCTPRGKMGRKCDLTTFGCDVEIIRFNNLKDNQGRPGLEFYEFQEDVDDDGSFVIPLPMNLDYVFTNEFGENEITNDPNKGIPTSACYRFRISPKDEGTLNGSLGRARTIANYLVPNIREYTSNNDEIDKSYAWSLDWDDYPTGALNDTVIFNNVFGSYYPKDYFYRFTYNKVFAVSSFMGVHYSKGLLSGRDNFLGLKEISPKDDEDCQSEVLTPPTNWGFRKFTFAILLALVINFFEKIIYVAYVGAIQVIIWPLQTLYSLDFIYINAFGVTLIDWRIFGFLNGPIEFLQRLGTVNLGTVTYPECETCSEVDIPTDTAPDDLTSNDPALLYEKVAEGTAVRDILNFTVDCENYNLNPPSSGNTTYTYRECSTNSTTAVTINYTGSPINACVRTGSLIWSGSDGAPTFVGQCDTPITYTPILNPDNAKYEFFLSDEYTPPSAALTSYSYVSGYTLSYIKSVQSTARQFIIKLTGYLPHGDARTSDKNLITNTLNNTTGNTAAFTFQYSSYPSVTGYTVTLNDVVPKYDPNFTTQPWIIYIDQNNVDYVWTGFTYEIYDTLLRLPFDSADTFNSDGLPQGCQSRNTMYDESLAVRTYCGTGITQYNTGGYVDIPATQSCKTLGKIPIAQTIYSESNKCGSCSTNSKFSEIRGGIYTIIPSRNSSNWGRNINSILEYARTKIVNKLFCEGIVSYSFIDNWLTGSLYMFPFKAKVRWDDEENLDLNFRWTKYCNNLVYFKVSERATNSPVKRFYYRSTKFNGSSFQRYDGFGDDFGTLAHPTTVVDLGPRDEFIKEICVDPSLDPNCSVVRSVGSTSFQNFKELLGLYINYRLDTQTTYTYKDFFNNGGFSNLLSPSEKLVLNGDVIQLVSINNEAGIEEFDLQNKNYGAYSPSVLDPDDYPNLFRSQSGTPNGPLPINFFLDTDGYRVRTCLNEPGRLTESSQPIPFFYWDKKGPGFGEGVNQSWNYGSVISQSLQGMTYNYEFTGDTSYNYTLFPMTKTYSGETITIGGVNLNDVGFDIETTGSTVYLTYGNQEEGFTVLYITSGTTANPLAGTLYTRVGDSGNWVSKPWNSDIDFIIKPTENNYTGDQQILSTPFLFYFGLRPGKTAVDKFIARFGPAGIFPTAE